MNDAVDRRGVQASHHGAGVRLCQTNHDSSQMTMEALTTIAW